MSPVPLTTEPPTALTSDEPALRALLAELGREAQAWRFEVAPNPCVGAALLQGGRVVARGFHRVYGGAHAEVEALAALRAGGFEAETLVVTLEPCSSHGKTPPCSEALKAARLRRIVVGAVDPDARHRGRGLADLRAAGIEVELLEGESDLHTLAPHFLRWTDYDRVRRARPWIIAKWAQTRSGQLRPPAEVGGGRWISSHAALDEVQLLRARVDAIVTGIGTVLADDPRLSVRPPGRALRAPLRIVLDPELRTPPDARLFAAQGPNEQCGAVHLFCLAGAPAARHRALEAAGAAIHGLLPDADGLLPLREVLSALWDLGVQRALLEAGPTLQKAFLASELVDQLRIYSGAVNGGQGPSLAAVLDPARLKQRLDRELGPDSVLEAFL